MSASRVERYLQRLEWTTLRRLDGILQGDYRTLIRGAGLDLADLREYLPTDDVRHIDWNVTARFAVPHVRRFHEDRDLTAWLALDLSPSMRVGSDAVRKQTLLFDFMAIIGRVLVRHGNRLGVVYHDGLTTRAVPARSGRMHLLQLLHTVAAVEPPDRSPPTDLQPLLQTVQAAAKSRAVLFLVSDFYSTTGWERLLGQLALRHEVVAVRVWDPLEHELPNLGLFTVQDAETGEQLTIDSTDRVFRQRFALLAQQREEALRAIFARCGVDALELSTRSDLVESIVHFVEARRRRGALAAGMQSTVSVLGRTR